MMTLKQEKETPPAVHGRAPAERSNRDDNMVLITFPKEYEKRLADSIDKRFTVILLVTILFDIVSIAYLVSHAPTEMSDKELARTQKKFAELFLQKMEIEREANFIENLPLKELPEEQTPSGAAGEGRGAIAGRRRGAAATGDAGYGGGNLIGGGHGVPGPIGRRTLAQISDEVSRAGILGLLTSNSGLASGDAAEDVLSGNNAPEANLDQALAKVSSSGLRRGSAEEADKPLGSGGSSSREVRGSRATNVAGIDALVQGLGEGKAQGVQRSGGLEVGNDEPLIEETADGKAIGSRDREAVAAIVAKHTSAIQYCYQRELKRNPNLKGKLVVRFVITPQGTVASVTIVSSTLGNSTVENCIVERIKRWDDFGAIDPSKGNTTFRQVYTFGY
ncbi:MAG: TonB family protein [candidate division KSB1 bacterium]|nr:TonB family protein [candidate division KSB1 bacterium]MDZ7305234.1 TonB family protein [candidate division KSB1 bacterium]MDZ7311501.1 TonB family protein [candidate division KSB1 bacterium]